MKRTLTLLIALLAPLAMPAIRARAAEVKGVETSPGIVILGRYVAVDNVCAWPSLALLPDGNIAAVVQHQATRSDKRIIRHGGGDPVDQIGFLRHHFTK